MKIAIMGLGYVGAVSGACLAEMGNEIVGVDPNELKVDMVNSARAPIVEQGFPELMEKVVNAGSFTATTDWMQAVTDTDMAIVCVGTPSNANGSIDLKYVRRVAENIGEAMAGRNDYYVVVVRSTVFPGSVEGVVVPALEMFSGKKAGKDFGVCMMPEFLREGSSIHDFYNPPRTVIGQLDQRSGDDLAEIFSVIDAPLVRTDIRVAEMVKYADNCFHALKVVFANEIGNLCKKHELDSHKVMEIFCMDTKLNLSPYYLKPGFAFGGSCLPKDLRAVNYVARMKDLELPVMNAILPSNDRQVRMVLDKVASFKGKTIGFLGLSFKGGTDDLRESPIVELVEALIGKGFDIRIYDKYVAIARLVGSNREYIEKEIPHISSLMCDSAEELVKGVDVVVVGNRGEEFEEALVSRHRKGQVVVDLVRILQDPGPLGNDYYGICW